jgi:DNA polymerase/3'-5' exonuclease PolX
MKTQISLLRARTLAEGVEKRLAPYCKLAADGKPYIEVAGSIRRRRPWVHDVDVVLIPGDSWNLYQEILALCRPFKPKPDGPKIKSFVVSGVPVDIYIADEKSWATLLLIRTGSARNNKRLCYLAQDRGWQLRADGSGLFNEKEERIAGDTELSIFRALGLGYQEPWERE